jgi:glycosyltransferase involved in cell wall biosynthesis
MAAGVPVIATPVGAIPDVMTDGIHGQLVPSRDAVAIGEAIAALARDRERLGWMSRACRKRVHAAYSIERLARELALHYQSLAGGETLGTAGVVPLAVRESLARHRAEPIDTTREG